MSSLYQSVLSEAAYGRMLSDREVSRFTPDQIRQAIAELVSNNQVQLADALAAAGLSLYPKNEEILAIAALLAEMQQDWLSAGDLLEQLLDVQEGLSPVSTWQHWIRVLRCQVEPVAALHATECALQIHPNHPALLAEKQSLQDMLTDNHAYEAASSTH